MRPHRETVHLHAVRRQRHTQRRRLRQRRFLPRFLAVHLPKRQPVARLPRGQSHLHRARLVGHVDGRHVPFSPADRRIAVHRVDRWRLQHRLGAAVRPADEGEHLLRIGQKAPVVLVQQRRFPVQVALARAARDVHHIAVAQAAPAQIIDRVRHAHHRAVIVHGVARHQRVGELRQHTVGIVDQRQLARHRPLARPRIAAIDVVADHAPKRGHGKPLPRPVDRADPVKIRRKAVIQQHPQLRTQRAQAAHPVGKPPHGGVLAERPAVGVRFVRRIVAREKREIELQQPHPGVADVLL